MTNNIFIVCQAQLLGISYIIQVVYVSYYYKISTKLNYLQTKILKIYQFHKLKIMRVVSPIQNQTYSESLIGQLLIENLKKDMKKLTLSVFILNAILTIVLFIQFNALPYALFLLAESLTAAGITFFAIKFNKVTENVHRIQRIVVFIFTIIESVFTLTLGIFSIAVSAKAPGIVLSVLFMMVVPGIIIIGLKLYFVFFKKRIEKKKAEEEMKLENNENYYTYHEIGETKDPNSKL